MEDGRKHLRLGPMPYVIASVLVAGGFVGIPRLTPGGSIQAKDQWTQAMVAPNGPLGKSLEAYKWDMGEHPNTKSGLAALFAPRGSGGARYKGPYLEGTLDDFKDPWGNPYEYRCPGLKSDQGYDLWSRGPDGVNDDGKAGSDDIKNWK